MAQYLAIIEHGYRGSVETQFADVLYLVRELNRQLGGLDLMLRGLAVTYAVKGQVPKIQIGDRTLDTLPDPRDSLRTLIEEGVGVRVDQADLYALGLTKDDGLLDGIEFVSWDDKALCWGNYRDVWFL
ncbi:MAG TPA: hypothetical protein VGM75_27395 [Pseudonocardiaceae bacterium]|jgi:hypothetical protein